MLTLPRNISCGYFDCSDFGNLETSPCRIVGKYEIEFYLEDGKTTTTDERTYEIKKNYIQIAKPGQTRNSELPFKTAYLKFDVEGELADRLSAAPEYFCSSHPEKIYNLIDEIILLNEEKAENLRLYIKILSFLNLIFSDAEIPAERSGKNYAVIIAAKRYIENNFERHITLKDIAENIHLSEIYFRTIFTETLGISPHQYLIDCRIENAKKLLWDTNISIIEVAEKSGFGCQQYLNKVFKKAGITPNEYRKGFQKKYSL